MSGTPRIAEPGIYDLPDDVYLADPVILPSLNNSTAKLIVSLSPRHAWAAHPRLGMAELSDEATEAQDIGHVAHEMFLRGESRVRVLNVADFRTARAKELRDQAINEGRIPLKADRYDGVMRVVEKLEDFRRRTGAFTRGKAEQTLVWREGDEYGRCKPDWLPDEPEAYLWDLKTTSGRSTPQSWQRGAYDFGYDMQAVYYCRGCECVRGEPPEGMRFCVIETSPPYGIKVFEFSPAAIADASAEVADAIRIWARCRASGEWPSYSDDVEWIDPPPWKLREREWRRHQRSAVLSPADAVVVARMINSGNLAG